eukprot:5927565-Alexandrium_andersonii.AAC.1
MTAPKAAWPAGCRHAGSSGLCTMALLRLPTEGNARGASPQVRPPRSKPTRAKPCVRVRARVRVRVCVCLLYTSDAADDM